MNFVKKRMLIFKNSLWKKFYSLIHYKKKSCKVFLINGQVVQRGCERFKISGIFAGFEIRAINFKKNYTGEKTVCKKKYINIPLSYQISNNPPLINLSKRRVLRCSIANNF
jgi:hypothetical protein